MEIESRLYHYGIGVGLPYRALNSVANAVDRARHAREIAKRRRIARKVLANSHWEGFIPKDRGYAIVSPNTLPGAREAVDAARAVIDGCRTTGWKTRRNNPFHQCETAEIFRDYPALMEFALSDDLLQIACDYLGLVPQLKEIGIWLTPPQERQFSSQLYHLDKPEGQLLKLFLNIDENGEDSGALTFLPADVSRKVRRLTGYENLYYRHDGRLTDEAVFAHCSRDDQVALTGAAGAGGFVDTSNCFHFGSRCRSGERKMFTVSYMLPHKARNRRTPMFDLVPEPGEELRRQVLSGAAFNFR